jgi:hypothetical protein
MSAFIDAKGRQTLNTIRPQALAAKSILVMAHSGIIYGNSPENQKVASDPASKATSEKAQDRNRRVIIALIP